MRKIVIIVLITFIFRPLMPLVEYCVNYDYISQVLCVNLDQPDLGCNGKCYIAKELVDQLETQTILKLDKVASVFDVSSLLVHEYNYCLLAIAYSKTYRVSKLYADLYSYLPISLLLKPPISKLVLT